jgi:hypothetical protein
MKNLSVILLTLFITACGSTPAVITETKIKYVDRIVLEEKSICCNCEPIPMCEYEAAITTNGELASTYVCLLEQKKLENQLKLQCK